MRYILDVTLEQAYVVKMLFSSKRKAENARRKLAAEMAKGRYKNVDDLVEIKSDASTYSISPSRVISVSVNDNDVWLEHQAEHVRKARELGIPIQGDEKNG